MNLRSCLSGLLPLALMGLFSQAPCLAEFRTWTAASGGFQTEAEFIALRDGTVHLRLRDGNERAVALNKLSTADQDYARGKAQLSSSGRTDRVRKLEREADACESAEEALRHYRVFRDDPRTTDAERQAIAPDLEELRGLADKKMVRMAGKWATPEAFRERRNKANSLMKQGLELLRLKQEDAFRAKFAEAAKVEPELIRADFMIGMLYSMFSSKYSKSKQYFEACAKREPDNVAVLNNLALAAMRHGDMNIAIQNWRKAVKLSPNQCIVQNLGRLMDQAGKGKVSVPKASLDQAATMYATLLGMEKYERVDLKMGWLWMFIDEESMSLAKQESKDEKPVESPVPQAAEDGSVVTSGGTGFVVFPHYLLTNNHVIDGGTSYDIQTSDGPKGKLLKATLVAKSEKPDLAILHCPELEAEPLAIDPALLHRGTDIMTFGYPEMLKLGASLKATRGVISAVPSSAVEDMYLYDAIVNHGNSGGPVCDNHGNVVAVTTIMTNTEGKYGGGIPAAAALAFVRAHVPGFEALEPSREALDWPGVDQRASPATVLIWTRSKTPGSSPTLASAGYFEDRDCMVCNGLGVLKCRCHGGTVVVQEGRRTSVQPCPICKGKLLVPCSVCSGLGKDPELVRIVPVVPPAGSNPPPSRSQRPQPSLSRPAPSSQPGSDGSSVAWRNFALDARLHETLRAAARARRTADSPMAGSGDQPFREINLDGGILIGLYLHVSEYRGYTVVSSVKPVFYEQRGRDMGSYHGPGGGLLLHAIARPGYAVGGIRVRSGQGIDSLSVVYMRIKGEKLDPADAYESPAYGGTGGGGRPAQLLGGTGAPIVGLHGALSNDPASGFIGLGVVTVADR